MSKKIPADTKFAISNIEKENVFEHLLNIDISKAAGTDGIGPRLLKLAAPHIAEKFYLHM